MDDLQLHTFSTVFQSYQEDGQVKMKPYLQLKRSLPRVGLEPGTATCRSSVGQHLSY